MKKVIIILCFMFAFTAGLIYADSRQDHKFSNCLMKAQDLFPVTSAEFRSASEICWWKYTK